MSDPNKSATPVAGISDNYTRNLNKETTLRLRTRAGRLGMENYSTADRAALIEWLKANGVNKAQD